MLSEKKDYVSPRFSIKSSLLLLLSGIIGGVLIPYIFYTLNWSTSLATMLSLPILVALTISYSQYFIETKRGYSKGFWVTLIFSLVILEVLTYFWLYKGFIF